MNIQLTKSPIGLDGVPAAETVLSHVDGERGELIIAGERVGDLARKTGFEGVTARLWSGGTGQPIGEAEVRAALGAARERAFARLPELLRHTRGMSIVDGFRAAVAGLRAEAGLDARGHDRRRVSGDRRRAGAAREGQRAGRARSDREPCRRYAVDDAAAASPSRARWRRSTPISSRCATTA